MKLRLLHYRHIKRRLRIAKLRVWGTSVKFQCLFGGLKGFFKFPHLHVAVGHVIIGMCRRCRANMFFPELYRFFVFPDTRSRLPVRLWLYVFFGFFQFFLAKIVI